MNIKNLRTTSGVMNTGKATDALQPGLVISGMFVPYDWTLAIAPGTTPTAILAALESALSALLIHDTPLSRGHYIGPFDAFNDKSEATTYQTLGYGRKVKTQRQIITKEYQIVEGGVEYWRAIQSFTGKIDQYKWIEFDNEGVVYGTQTLSTTTGLVTGIQGFRLSALEPQDRKQANKGSIEERILNLTFQDSAEANENLYSIETGIDIDQYVADLGVTDVTLTATGVMVAKVVSFAVTSFFGGVNICETVPSMIVTASFILTNKETGSTVITVTSVAITNGLMVLTLSGAGAGWVPGDTMQVQLTAVSTLATAGFRYYESNIAEVIMVA